MSFPRKTVMTREMLERLKNQLDAGISQREIALCLGVSQVTVSRLIKEHFDTVRMIKPTKNKTEQ